MGISGEGQETKFGHTPLREQLGIDLWRKKGILWKERFFTDPAGLYIYFRAHTHLLITRAA